MDKIWKIIDLVKWGEDYLSSKGIDSPRLSMEMIIGKVLNLKRIDLYLKFDQPLLSDELKELKGYVRRLSKNEPLQYVIGHTDFLDIKIITEKGVLIPRPETEEMCSEIIKNFKDNVPGTVLDIGTGSGCIALALANSFSGSDVYGIDVSDEALEIAEKNKRLNKISNVKFFNINVLEKKPKKKFPLIVSNPPYIASNDIETLERNVQGFEPEMALTDGKDGLSFYRKFAEIFPEMLEKNGKFYLELNEDLTDEIFKIFLNKNCYSIDIQKDMFGKKRFLIGRMN